MSKKQILSFGPFRLDLENRQLWRGKRVLTLKNKAFDVLCYLAERPGQLVTKEALFQALWSDTVVGDPALAVCVSELRRVLGDRAKAPQFIQTVHGKGYRFVAQLHDEEPSQELSRQTLFVGRETESTQLQACFEKASGGERQIVFVSGEAGIGKTSLIENVLADLAVDKKLWIGWGQCIEQYGVGEAYRPVLEALGRLCRGPEGTRIMELLDQYAPTWLVQMPALLSAAKLKTLQGKVSGATQIRMLREMAEAFEALTAEQALVLVLEDLHWADPSTVELLASLARRRERARLCVLGTYRPVDVIVGKHPLKGVKQELQMHGQCEELPLDFLDIGAISEYLKVRFPEHTLPEDLPEALHQRTDGSPLFMVNMVDYLVGQGVIVQKDGEWQLTKSVEALDSAVPHDLRQLIERQIAQTSQEEQQLLEIAAIAGVEFSAASVAAGGGKEIEEVEAVCEALARREQFVEERGLVEWPDGTVSGQYGFLHALYKEVLYERVAAARRVRLHRQIGEREEAGYGDRVREIAAELAVHFEHGRMYHRAVHYYQQAAENAVQRSAYVEAVSLLTKGVELLKQLPDGPDRAQQELTLQLALSMALTATRGYADPEVEQTYTRALDLCEQGGTLEQHFRVFGGFYLVTFNRGEFHKAREWAEKLLDLAQREDKPTPLGVAYGAVGGACYWMGELRLARSYGEQSLAHYNPQEDKGYWLTPTADARVDMFSYRSLSSWMLGYPDQSLESSRQAVALARELAHPFSLAYALNMAIGLYLLASDTQVAQEYIEELIQIANEQGFPFFIAWGSIYQGRMLVEQKGRAEEGIAQIQRGISAFEATGSGTGRPAYLSMLAGACAKVGRIEEGLGLIAEAQRLVQTTGQRLSEAGLYIIKGWLLLSQSPNNPAAVESCFLQAIEVARRQEAKWWELRAVMSLCQLWQPYGKKEDARQMLAEIYDWFTEGFDTPGLQAAKTMLEQLS